MLIKSSVCPLKSCCSVWGSRCVTILWEALSLKIQTPGCRRLTFVIRREEVKLLKVTTILLWGSRCVTRGNINNWKGQNFVLDCLLPVISVMVLRMNLLMAMRLSAWPQGSLQTDQLGMISRMFLKLRENHSRQLRQQYFGFIKNPSSG